MSPRRVRVSMHYKIVPPLQKAEVTGVVGAARSGCLAIEKLSVSTVWWEKSVGRCPAAGSCSRTCAGRKLCLAFKGFLQRPRNKLHALVIALV